MEQTSSPAAEYKPWPVFIKSFCFLFPTLLLGAFALLFGTCSAFGIGSPIQVSLFSRGYDFHEVIESPIFYISSIALLSSLLGAIWLAVILPKFPRHVLWQMLVLPWLAVILAGPLWGLIWSINRWPPAGFSDAEVMLLFYKTDMLSGLHLSWLAAAQSYPLNILSYAVFCGLLLLGKRFFCARIAVPDNP